MTILETTTLTFEQKKRVHLLWNQEYPEKLGYKTCADVDNYLNNLTGKRFFLLKNDQNEIEGWAMTFIRESEKWFAIIIDGNMPRNGKGTLLLNKLKENERALNGWVIDHNNDKKRNGELYKSPMEFYTKNKFLICPETRYETPVLSAVKIVWQRE